MSTSTTASLFSQLKSSNRLPSPPGTALRVLELCRNDDTDVKEIADVVMADPALSGRLLRYANSSVVGASREVASVRDAVLYLGLRTVKLTALGFSLASGMESRCTGFSLKSFWTESVVTAILSRRLAQHFGADREEAFTAGLLAGIGRLALAQGIPEEYGAVLQDAPVGQEAIVSVERRCLGTDHVEFGGELLSQWGLPGRLVEAVVYQLDLTKAQGPAQSLAQTIHVSATLAPLFLPEGAALPEVRQAAREVVEKTLSFNEQSWQQVAEEALTDYHQISAVLDIELDQASMFDLYAEAQEEATRVGIVAQLEKSRALEENRSLLRRATTDALTGVANRAKFEERMQELTAGATRGHGHFALLMFDIDHFKKFNDTYGHAVGDLVLKNVAQTVRRTLREVDLLARYGGEEFVIIAPHTDQRGACTIAARTRKCVEDMRVETDGQELRVTISVGLALSSDYDTAPTAKEIVTDSDKQLYLSKETGRNTWSYRGRSAAQVMRAAATP